MSEKKVQIDNFDDYANFVTKLASKYSMGSNHAKYGTAALGLCGEAGEIADIVERLMHDHDRSWNRVVRNELIKELGDVLWYAVFAAKNIAGIKFDFNHDTIPDSFGDLNRNLKWGSGRLVVTTSRFADLFKKIMFHGMPLEIQQVTNDLNSIYQSVVFFAEIVLCCTIKEIMQKNVEKLSDRYKSLEFSTEEFMAKEAAKTE